MAEKSKIRSMRFSDTMIELIEQQAGETFTAKFEALVTKCAWELPRKEEELKRIQAQIDQERKKLQQAKKIAIELDEMSMRINCAKGIIERIMKNAEEIVEVRNT